MLGITLSRRDLKENDQIITLYTKEAGKIEAVARGIKKIISKNSSALEPFSVLELEIVPGKEKSYITKVFIEEIYTHIRSEAGKIIMGGQVLELVDRAVMREVRDEKLFKLIHSFFYELNKLASTNFLLWPAFLIKFWSHLGFTPVLDKCVKCRKNLNSALNYFDVSQGGAVCISCGQSNNLPKISSGMIKGFQFLIKKSWGEIQDLKLSSVDCFKLYSLVKEFVEYHSGVKAPNQISALKKLFFSKTIPNSKGNPTKKTHK